MMFVEGGQVLWRELRDGIIGEEFGSGVAFIMEIVSLYFYKLLETIFWKYYMQPPAPL